MKSRDTKDIEKHLHSLPDWNVNNIVTTQVVRFSAHVWKNMVMVLEAPGTRQQVDHDLRFNLRGEAEITSC